MRVRRAIGRGLTVRSKLLLLASVPAVVGAIVIGTFLLTSASTNRACTQAILWQRHATLLAEIDWAARSYLDGVSDRLIGAQHRGQVPEAAAALRRASRESLRLARSFTARERRSEQRLSDEIGSFLAIGERVDAEPVRFLELAAFYEDRVKVAIRQRRQAEAEGSRRDLLVAGQRSAFLHLASACLSVVTVVGMSVMAVRMARGLAGAVHALQRSASAVAAGNLEQPIGLESRDELGQLATSMQVMAASLRRQRDNQFAFLAAVMHDLRNPLGALKTATEVLTRAPAVPDEARLRRTLALIGRQVDRLSRLTDDLLEAARIEAGQIVLAPEPTDVRALLRETQELYAHASPAHAIEVREPDEPVVALCDPARVEQVLNNLVSNAIKYSPQGGRVTLAVEQHGDTAVLSVSDEGVGIEPAHLAEIFEPFRRVSPTRDVLPGIGLGLSTSRKIALAHGGAIDVESTPGRGSTFRLRLPLLPPGGSSS